MLTRAFHNGGCAQGLLQGMVGKYILCAATGEAPSPNMLKMLEAGYDKHKTRDWMLLAQAAMQQELCRHWVLEVGLDAAQESDAVQRMRVWLESKATEDNTIKVVMMLLRVMQHRELLHQVRALYCTASWVA